MPVHIGKRARSVPANDFSYFSCDLFDGLLPGNPLILVFDPFERKLEAVCMVLMVGNTQPFMVKDRDLFNPDAEKSPGHSKSETAGLPFMTVYFLVLDCTILFLLFSLTKKSIFTIWLKRSGR